MIFESLPAFGYTEPWRQDPIGFTELSSLRHLHRPLQDSRWSLDYCSCPQPLSRTSTSTAEHFYSRWSESRKDCSHRKSRVSHATYMRQWFRLWPSDGFFWVPGFKEQIQDCWAQNRGSKTLAGRNHIAILRRRSRHIGWCCVHERWSISGREHAFGLGHLAIGLTGLCAGYAFLRRKNWSWGFLIGINTVTIIYSTFAEALAEIYALLPPGINDALIGTIIAVIFSAVILYLLLVNGNSIRSGLLLVPRNTHLFLGQESKENN